jgi:tetratricopeptide (TPR) repeat protein
VYGRRASDGRLDAGRDALARGQWRAAQEHFAAALQDRESASALEGLSEALFWLDEVPQSLELRERAFQTWRDKGELGRAARAAAWLAREHAAVQGDGAAAQEWLRRAARVAEEAGPGAELAWVHLAQARFAPNSEEALAHASRAHDCARTFGDRDLEMYALSEQGRALVMRGRVDEGMKLLDEAAAAATSGAMQGVYASGETLGNMIVACDRALDLERAAQWCRVADELARRHHFVPLFACCQTVYGGLLAATGKWAAAESALTRAARTVEKGHPALQAEPRARLARLRVRQGSLDVAASLLAGIEDDPQAALAAAELHLARGDGARAASLLERRLRPLEQDTTLAAPLLEALVDAHLQAGDRARARHAAGRLDMLATENPRPLVEAAAVLAAVRVREEGEEVPAEVVARAVDVYATLGLLFEAARARLWGAQATMAERPHAARAEAEEARQVFEQLGAAPWAQAAAELLQPRGGATKAPRRKRR